MIAPNQTVPPAVFPAEYVHCPRCNALIRRTTGGEGAFFVTCDESLKGTVAGRRGDRCGQNMFVVATDGLAFVIPISRDERDEYLKRYGGRARMVYAAQGRVLLPREESIIPSALCSSCGSGPHKLFDLFGGECRKCHGESAK